MSKLKAVFNEGPKVVGNFLRLQMNRLILKSCLTDLERTNTYLVETTPARSQRDLTISQSVTAFLISRDASFEVVFSMKNLRDSLSRFRSEWKGQQPLNENIK